MGRAVRSPVSLLGMGSLWTRLHMSQWHDGDVRLLDVAQLGDRYRRYRFTDPDAETAMAGSLRRYGQISPLVVCLRDEAHELLDGFKRLAAARTLGINTLNARLLEVDERAAKAAIYGLNDTGRRPHEWEEAWIVHALVREDGMTQVEAAELLGRHKSWVCRRLALIEKLVGEARGFAPGIAFRSGCKVAGAVAHGQPECSADDIASRRLDVRRTEQRGRSPPYRTGPVAAGVYPGPAPPGPGAGTT